MVVEEMLMIEAHERANQTPIGIIRRRFDIEVAGAKTLGKIVTTDCHLTHHSKSAASSPFQRPEEIRISACVRDANIAVGGDHFGF